MTARLGARSGATGDVGDRLSDVWRDASRLGQMRCAMHDAVTDGIDHKRVNATALCEGCTRPHRWCVDRQIGAAGGQRSRSISRVGGVDQSIPPPRSNCSSSAWKRLNFRLLEPALKTSTFMRSPAP